MAYNLTYTLNNDKTGYIVTKCTGTPEDLYIPNIYNNRPVLEIGEKAFENCTTLKSIIIPNSVEKMGVAAFSGCSALEKMSIPFTGEAREATGAARFFGRIFYAITGSGQHTSYVPNSLKIVNITDAKSIKSYSFASCKTIEKITISGEVYKIESYAFSSCSALQNVKLSDRITEIADHAFMNCDSLETINIPNNVTKIESVAFYQCKKLKNIEFPLGLQIIGAQAFFNCYALNKITIPPNIVEIQEKAFVGCNALKEVYLTPAIPPIAGQAVFSAVGTYTIYCYGADIAKYQAATNWNILKDKMVIDDTKLHFVLNAINEKIYIKRQVDNNKIDITIAGKSILEDDIATIPTAQHGVFGVVTIPENAQMGIQHVVNPNNPAASGLGLIPANSQEIATRTGARKPITIENMEPAVRTILTGAKQNTTTGSITLGNHDALTDDEKASACNWIGAVKQIEYSSDIHINNTPNAGSDAGRVGLLYGVGFKGNQITFPIDIQSKKWTIMCRDGNGNAQVSTPQLDYHCATKKYVDNAIAGIQLTGGGVDVQINGTSIVENGVANIPLDNKLDKITKEDTNEYAYITKQGTQTVKRIGSAGGAVGTLAEYMNVTYGNTEPDGYLLTHTPEKDYQCANKKFVNDTVNGVKNITFASYKEMVDHFNEADRSAYSIGQNIYIRTRDVPDLWVYKQAFLSPSEFNYTYDSVITNQLKENGYITIGWYLLAPLETQKVDLTEYKTKDVQIDGTSIVENGIANVLIWGIGGIMNSPGNGLCLSPANTTEIANRTYARKPITIENMDMAVKECVVNNKDTLSDEEKSAACNWLGAVKKIDKDTKVLVYTNDDNSGQSTTHYLADSEKTYLPYAIPMIYGDRAGKNAVSGYLLTGVPINNYHAANKQYVDDIVGDVSSALDEIIALQEAYIGTTFEELHEYAQDIVSGGEA